MGPFNKIHQFITFTETLLKNSIFILPYSMVSLRDILVRDRSMEMCPGGNRFTFSAGKKSSDTPPPKLQGLQNDAFMKCSFFFLINVFSCQIEIFFSIIIFTCCNISILTLGTLLWNDFLLILKSNMSAAAASTANYKICHILKSNRVVYRWMHPKL